MRVYFLVSELPSIFFGYDHLSSRYNLLTAYLGDEGPVSHHMSDQASEICKLKGAAISEQL